jgi:hypothetical protein
MNSTPGSEINDRRSWACAILGIEAAEVTPAACKQQLQKTLAESHFVPSLAIQQAYDCLVGHPLPDPGNDVYRTVRQASLQQEVGQLAATFFDLPVRERASRWESLWRASDGFPRCRARLEALQKGLSCNLGKLRKRDPEVAKLGNMVADLFVLPGMARAASRYNLTAQLMKEISIWEPAAKRLRRKHRRLAGLEPIFVENLADVSRVHRLRSENRLRPKQTMTQKRAPSQPGIAFWLVLLFSISFAIFRAFIAPPQKDARPRQVIQRSFPETRP